jgi:hypothetical protein
VRDVEGGDRLDGAAAVHMDIHSPGFQAFFAGSAREERPPVGGPAGEQGTPRIVVAIPHPP